MNEPIISITVIERYLPYRNIIYKSIIIIVSSHNRSRADSAEAAEVYADLLG